MNPAAVQQALGLNLTADGTLVKTTSGDQQTVTGNKTTTIIQPATAHTGTQQYIVTTTSMGDGVDHGHAGEAITINQGQTVYPAHVQYVDGTDSSLYASSNGQMQTYHHDYGQGTMYTPVSGAYYQQLHGTQVSGIVPAGSTVQTVQGQLIQQSGGTYLIQGGTMDGEGTPLTHTTRASPATFPNEGSLEPSVNGHLDFACSPGTSVHVQWLLDNYETAEGVSLPRSTLYYHYLRHCQETNLDPMNPASFGKLIRSVFLGLRTRRLGTRGNSKYHYYGIRIKASSPLNQYTDDQTMAMRQQPMYQSKKPSSKVDGESDTSQPGSNNPGSNEPSQSQQQHQQFLGDASLAIPNFDEIDVVNQPLPEGITINDVRIFELMYREHAEAIVDVVVNLQFSLIEALWQGFWRNQPIDQHNDNDFERKLPKEKLFLLCKYDPIHVFVRKSDYAFYQAIIEVLIPDVLRPIPSSLTQAIRNFAKSLENWLKSAMQGVPDEMIKTKIGAVSAFAQTLRRYTSLNHLAQAARAVLQNTSQINQMLTDLNRVDFANVQEQASWVCQCDDTVVQQLEQDFKKTLKQQTSLEQWAIWLESVVNQVLITHEGSPNFPKAARQFLLKWSFYSSMVIRDLTLRSAASFGSFHLIRLLYDEYMFYLVEHKVARATGETPIAVMGEVRQFSDLSSAVALGNLESDKKITVAASTAAATTTKPATTNTAANSTTVMLLTPTGTNTSAGTTTGSTTQTVTVRPVSNGIGGATVNTTTGNKLVVLSTHASTGIMGATNTLTPSTAANPTTLTVRPAVGTTGNTKTHTILVMPISSTAGTDGSPQIKRLKTE
ncbi:hypothetical protein SNE40_004716 [Patella caerulea]|uniref:RFX-type winged-helix domain-containing protein n=1 Tax=Patella caerulea TaxID=87958 RepID=A0AAN8JYM6_PATCE